MSRKFSRIQQRARTCYNWVLFQILLSRNVSQPVEWIQTCWDEKKDDHVDIDTNHLDYSIHSPFVADHHSNTICISCKLLHPGTLFIISTNPRVDASSPMPPDSHLKELQPMRTLKGWSWQFVSSPDPHHDQVIKIRKPPLKRGDRSLRATGVMVWSMFEDHVRARWSRRMGLRDGGTLLLLFRCRWGDLWG